MIVEIIKTGEKREVNESYGGRLIEQGIAIPVNPVKANATANTTTPAAKKDKGSGEK